jgi:transketolase
LARRLRAERGRVWVFMSDGEFQEGQTWEAFAALAHHHLGNLGVYIDANAQQCDGAMKEVMTIEPLAERLSAFGADVREVDGHDSNALAAAADGFGGGERPLAVIARTDPCRGIDLLRERAPNLHYVRFKSEAEFGAYRELLTRMSAAAESQAPPDASPGIQPGAQAGAKAAVQSGAGA